MPEDLLDVSPALAWGVARLFGLKRPATAAEVRAEYAGLKRRGIAGIAGDGAREQLLGVFRRHGADPLADFKPGDWVCWQVLKKGRTNPEVVTGVVYRTAERNGMIRVSRHDKHYPYYTDVVASRLTLMEKDDA